jgi:hypothetical protein
MNVSITNKQIEKLFGKDVLVTNYENLNKINSLDDFFKTKDALIVLYEYQNGYGHWVLIIKSVNKKGSPALEFFDSYGTMPDRHLTSFSKSIRDQYGMRYPKLSELLLKSKYPIEYNNHRLQKHDPKISTCGRWCVLRALFRDEHIDKFVKRFKKKKFNGKKVTPDKLAVLSTPFLK